MRSVAGQRGVNVLACWICFLLIASTIQKAAGGYRTGRYSCCSGCTSCSCTAGGGGAPGTNCNACASGPGQSFVLQGGACVCKPGYGKVRQQAPANNGYYGCSYVRRPGHAGYWGGSHAGYIGGRRLLQDAPAEEAASPAPDAANSAVAPEPADADASNSTAGSSNSGDASTSQAVETSNSATSSIDSSSPSPAPDSSGSSQAGPTSADASTPAATSDIQAPAASRDGNSSFTPPSSPVAARNRTPELEARVAQLEQAAADRARAAAAEATAKQQAAAGTREQLRQAALQEIAMRHNATIAKAREAAAAAKVAQKTLVAAAAVASNTTRLRAKATAATATKVANDKQRMANRVEKAVAAAQKRMAAKRTARKAALKAKFNAQLALVAAKLAARKSLLRQPASLLGSSSSSSATAAQGFGVVPSPSPGQQGPTAAQQPASPNTQELLALFQQQQVGVPGSTLGRLATGAAATGQLANRARATGVAVSNGPRVTAGFNASRGMVFDPSKAAERERRRAAVISRQSTKPVRPGLQRLTVAPGEQRSVDPSTAAAAAAAVPVPVLPALSAMRSAAATTPASAGASAAGFWPSAGSNSGSSSSGSGSGFWPSKSSHIGSGSGSSSGSGSNSGFWPTGSSARSGNKVGQQSGSNSRRGSSGFWPAGSTSGGNTGSAGSRVGGLLPTGTSAGYTGLWPHPSKGGSSGNAIGGSGVGGSSYDDSNGGGGSTDYNNYWGDDCNDDGDTCYYLTNSPPPCSSCGSNYVWVWVPCAPCPPGFVSPGGDPNVATCIPCPFGTVPNNGQTECVADPNSGGDGGSGGGGGLPYMPRPHHNRSPTPWPPSSPTPSSSPSPDPNVSPNPNLSPSPRPSPSPGPNQPVAAKNVKVFTSAPNPVWVDFMVEGSAKPLTITIIKGTGPTHGTLGPVDQKVRSVEYTPAKKYCSMDGTPDTFQYQVTDANGKMAKATAAVIVDCPDSVFTEDQFVTSAVGIPVDITTPVGGGVTPYKFTITGKPNEGQVLAIIAGEGDVTFTYQPNATYCSMDGFGDSFSFEVMEQYGTTASGVVDITILCPPAPIAAPELIFNMTPGTSLPIDLGITGSGPFRFEMLSPPLNGQLTNITTDGLTTFTPDPTYCSMFNYYDGFYYTVYDKYGQYADGAVTLNVICPDPPTAETQNFETPAQTPLEQHLIVNSTAQLFFDISLFPTHGTVDGVDERRVSLYTPDFDWCSMQDALDNWGFDVTDLFGQFTFALVFIKVVCPAAPKPQDQVIKMAAQLGLVINVTLSIPSGATPFYIETSIDPMNAFLSPIIINDKNPRIATTTFTPFDGYCNYEDVADPFNWIVYDPFGQTGEATCTVILRCPEAPTAKDQSVQLAVGEKEKLIKLQVTGSPPLDYLIYAPPGNGKLTKPTIDNTVIYTPNWDFCSVEGFLDTVFFMVSDSFGAAADGSLSINVLCPSPPSADDAYYAITVNTPLLEVKPVYGPADANLTIKVSDPPGFGTVQWNPATSIFTYTPTGGRCPPGKTDDFVFSVDDIYGQQTAFGTITIECLKVRRRGRLLLEQSRPMLALAGGGGGLQQH